MRSARAVTGGADDNPAGITTRAVARARFGYGLLWTALFTLLLMAGIPSLGLRSARE